MEPFTTLRREIRAELSEVDVLCLELRQLLQAGGARWAEERFPLELLAREALSNAVRHGCQEDPGRRVLFTCRLGTRRGILTVEDDGPGFDWKSGLERPVDEDASHGRGLALCLMYASKVLFNERGNRIVLVRQFKESVMPESNVAIDGTMALMHPGELTASTVGKVREQFKELLEAGIRELTLDLAGVQIVDSMGIGLLIQTYNSLAKSGGKLLVKNASGDLLNLFTSMRLDKRFTILD